MICLLKAYKNLNLYIDYYTSERRKIQAMLSFSAAEPRCRVIVKLYSGGKKAVRFQNQHPQSETQFSYKQGAGIRGASFLPQRPYCEIARLISIWVSVSIAENVIRSNVVKVAINREGVLYVFCVLSSS